jgi:hypothetical protein
MEKQKRKIVKDAVGGCGKGGAGDLGQLKSTVKDIFSNGAEGLKSGDTLKDIAKGIKAGAPIVGDAARADSQRARTIWNRPSYNGRYYSGTKEILDWDAKNRQKK